MSMSISSDKGTIETLVLSREELGHVIHALRTWDAEQSAFYQANPKFITNEVQKLIGTVRKITNYRVA